MERPTEKEPTVKTVARYFGDLPEKFGVPRQSGRVKSLAGRVVFEKEYSSPEALRGIEGFSHLWLIWGCTLSNRNARSLTVRPPRLGGNTRMGVFATRSPNRPSPLGLSAVRLVGVERENGALCLLVEGADLVSGTPVYDVKPYLPSCDCIPDARGGFAEEFTDYKLSVDIPEELLSRLPGDKREALTGLLSEDPRPGYKSGEGTYGLSFAGCEIAFTVDAQNVLHVTDIQKKKGKKS